MWFKRNTKYWHYVQWHYGCFDDWYPGTEFRSRKKVIKYALKMLARNSNVAPWRVVEHNEEEGGLRVVFEGGPRDYKVKKLRSSK